MNQIKIDEIIITNMQREVLPWALQDIIQGMQDHGYTEAYPIVLDEDNKLVDGGHRLAGCKKMGITEVPFIRKPVDVPHIQYAMQCNADRGRGRPDDVFDKAEYCWKLAKEGRNGNEIAEIMSFGRSLVTHHSNVKIKLHRQAWHEARFTKNPNVVKNSGNDVVNDQFTKVNWRETYFRALLSHLPHSPENPDKAVIRGQLQTIRAAIIQANNGKKVTAKWIDKEAQKYAWYIILGRYMRDNLASRVPLSDWRTLLKNIRAGVFGSKEHPENMERFKKATSAINERILGITLYQNNALQQIALLENKSVALAIADPPYNVTDNEWDQIGDDDEYMEWIAQFLDTLRPKLADDCHFFMCISPQYQARVEGLLIDKSWPLKSRIIWSHRNMSKGRDVADKFIGMWEMIFHCGTYTLNWPPEWDDERFEVQEWAAPQTNFEDKKIHPTQKPLGLYELFVKVGSKPGDIVLDPFAGSGTTGAACKAITQRQCILVELGDKYCKAIEKRLGIVRWQE